MAQIWPKDIYEATEEVSEKQLKVYLDIEKRLINELTEKVWQEDKVRNRARNYGILDEEFEPILEELKNTFLNEFIFVPLETVFLKFKDVVSEADYMSAKNTFIQAIENEWIIQRNMDPSWFDDRDVARAALKRGFGLNRLTQYHDDEENVCLSCLHL